MITMPYYVINHSRDLNWLEAEDDPLTFIVIVFVQETHNGFSTYFYSNSKKAPVVPLPVIVKAPNQLNSLCVIIVGAETQMVRRFQDSYRCGE